jgi:SanA protein
VRLVRKLALFLISVTMFVMFFPRIITGIYARSRIVEAEATVSKPVAIVFGAGLRRDGRPTQVLRDRVQTAAELFKDGKVDKLIMSGYNPSPFYNEPAAMREFALDLGIPDGAIILDLGGDRTLETCYRAKQIYGITNAFLVSQTFHLPRAVYTCSQMEITAVGVSADRYPYRNRSTFFWNLREIPATLVAFWELHFSRQGAAIALISDQTSS